MGEPRYAARDFHRIHDDFRVAQMIADMHDAVVAQLAELVAEQKRANQLLEWLGERLAKND